MFFQRHTTAVMMMMMFAFTNVTQALGNHWIGANKLQ
jgi:hypothetical protein